MRQHRAGVHRQASSPPAVAWCAARSGDAAPRTPCRARPRHVVDAVGEFQRRHIERDEDEAAPLARRAPAAAPCPHGVERRVRAAARARRPAPRSRRRSSRGTGSATGRRRRRRGPCAASPSTSREPRCRQALRYAVQLPVAAAQHHRGTTGAIESDRRAGAPAGPTRGRRIASCDAKIVSRSASAARGIEVAGGGQAEHARLSSGRPPPLPAPRRGVHPGSARVGRCRPRWSPPESRSRPAAPTRGKSS